MVSDLIKVLYWLDPEPQDTELLVQNTNLTGHLDIHTFSERGERERGGLHMIPITTPTYTLPYVPIQLENPKRITINNY